MARQVNVMAEFVGAVDAFEKQILDQVRKIIADTTEMLVSQAIALAPIDEGDLKRSIYANYSADGLNAVITVGVFYGIYVEMGTGIHAKNGDGRKTPWVYWHPEGRLDEKTGKKVHWVFTRGNEPQPYFYPAFEEAAQYFEREMNKIG